MMTVRLIPVGGGELSPLAACPPSAQDPGHISAVDCAQGVDVRPLQGQGGARTRAGRD